MTDGTAQQQQQQQHQVDENGVRSNDVLLGRGGATNNHTGNIRFRRIVAEHQDEYLKALKKAKIVIANRIVDIIHRNGGRFMKRDNTSDDWVEVTDKRAQEKTSQALREGLDVRNSTVRPSKMPRRYSDSSQSEEPHTAPPKKAKKLSPAPVHSFPFAIRDHKSVLQTLQYPQTPSFVHYASSQPNPNRSAEV